MKRIGNRNLSYDFVTIFVTILYDFTISLRICYNRHWHKWLSNKFKKRVIAMRIDNGLTTLGPAAGELAQRFSPLSSSLLSHSLPVLLNCQVLRPADYTASLSGDANRKREAM